MISHSRIKPSLLTYTHLLKGFAALDDIVNCKLILEKMTFMGHEPDLTFYTILIQAYAKAGDVQSAMSLHESVTNTTIVLDTRYYNALINMYAKASNRDNNESLATMVRLYEEMTVSLVPDEHTYTTMIDAFMKAREPRLAIFWFDVMQGRKPYSRQFVEPLGIPAVPIHPPIIPTAPTYTAIISGYAHQKNVAEALRWFQELCQSQTRPTEGNVPNIKTYTAVLHGFSKVGDMRGAENWIRRMENDSLETNSKSGFDRRVFNTLISGYASKHDYEGARKVLSQMGENGLHSDAITYGMLIDSHLKRTSSFKDGDIEAALQTYKTMISQGIKPTLHILTALISRLGHICGKSIVWVDLLYPDKEEGFHISLDKCNQCRLIPFNCLQEHQYHHNAQRLFKSRIFVSSMTHTDPRYQKY
ncbi:hypothetical protein BCR33DRAFT_224580 [Rhizoclosmatium globosum]|uniref:PROP1-like PPR domain-containing protein n=1 Tax=Rhizoclosmatium globosum TaxID=329046 RepID=A0A1Y2CBW3_9FUNG|nr:hypothetical protein BCR33DRAFT_224580 [Rhizoclosmatium globosum]|eukprot:ORY44519.1 hypothetical protein BCR33DRAFT_224580 [Rhizoclosmatium globosum]